MSNTPPPDHGTNPNPGDETPYGTSPYQQPQQPVNPFQASAHLQQPAYPPPSQPGTGYPVFARVVFIIALILCLLRVLLAAFSTFGAATMPADHPLGWTVHLEVVSSWMIAVMGLVGFGLMLSNKKVGIPFAWLSILGVVASIVCGLFQTPILFEMQGLAGDQASAAWVGVIIALGLRIAIMATTIAAIIVYSRWRNKNATAFYS